MKKNEYGLFTAITMIIGIVIGSGIFFKSDNILVATGGSTSLGILVFCIASIAIIFGSLTIAELASRNSKEGGIIAYAEEYYSKAVACSFGWMHTFIYYPALLVVVGWVTGIYTCMLFEIQGTLEKQIGIGVCAILVFFLLNMLSAKLGGYFQNLATVIKLIPLIMIAVIGLVWGDVSSIKSTDITNMQSFAWISAIAPISFSFDGWIIATAVGHEIKDAKKNLPIALIVAPIVILVIYILYFVGISIYVGPEKIMDLGDAHVNFVATNLFGPMGAKIVLIFVIISILGATNGLVLGMSRMPYSLAKRKMFPYSNKVSKMNEKLGIPLISAFVSLGICSVLVVAHYLTQKFGLLPNSDISEIAITMNYVLYVLLYYKVLKMGLRKEIKSKFRGIVCPIMAIVGSFIIALGSISNPLFILYTIICAMLIGAAVVFSKKQEKSINEHI
ncbi:APC family permease [Clostridium uliginosum]|uniref:Basic amino acid/polyamine antiporter, APA family n=1 Tax=Clostridium uliginosum TaxID=119641 RepID=A0A1I1GN45_9CLOT|nr:APC family permease [Clostridium uliginosum]SFC13157.1 basic amino acid/polyamine antiporter, APA family [Clostridium uliginosum]